uniref:Ribosomal RNA-processing protein 42 n=1 Tax=Amphimedon queenslandica TaxID=400682 RepID=A0A1X7SW66_AMPQE
VLEYSGGVLDCLSIAVKGALANTKIPKLTVIGEGEEQEIEISDNPFDSTSIDTNNVPVFVSLSLIGNQFIVDASHEEEACSLCQLSVGVNHKGSICSILKEGAGSFKHKQYNEAISLASEIGVSVIEKITLTSNTAPEKML